MDKVLEILTNPIVMAFAGFLVGFFLKEKKSKAILKLVNILIESIEIIDTEIKDIVSDDCRAKLTKIKAWISCKVGILNEERAILDKMLDNKGYLAKGVQK